MLFSTNSIGGYLAAFNLSKELRMGVQAMAKFRQFCDIKDAWGKVDHAGQTFTWDTMPMLTRASRALSETNTMPQGNATVLQGTLTINERGMSVPYTGFLESLAMIPVRAPLMKVLKYDTMVDLDALAWQEFNKTPLRVVSTSSADTAFTLTTNSSATATNTTFISKINVRAIVDGMKDRKIPFYFEQTDDYAAIARGTGLKLLKADLESVHQYTETGLAMIMNGEIGRYWQCRFIEQNNIPAGGAADSTTYDPFTDTSDAWNGSAGDWVFFFGEESVAEAILTPEEIRAKIPDDYGRSKGIAWYWLGGYGIAHGGSGSSNSSAAEARIVKFDSAV